MTHSFKSIVIFSLIVFASGLLVSFRMSSQETESFPKNQPISLVATIKKEPRIYGSSQMIAVSDLRVFVDLFPRYRVGEVLRVEGEVDFEGNIFNARVEKVGREKTLGSYFSKLRREIAERIGTLLPSRQATLVQGTVLGVDNIEKEFRDQLIKTGTIHVVVVSGQNLAIVAGLFLSMVKYLGRRQSLFLATGAVFLYAFLTGFEPPVVRASIMVLVSSIAIYYGRQTIPLWSLILAALIILGVWPWAIFEVSFQLTFAATLGIMTLGEWMTKIFTHPGKNTLLTLLINNAAVATGAYLFTAPIILFYFGQISLIGIAANILVAEAVAPVMILGFATAITSLISVSAAQPVAYLVYVPAFYFVKIVEFFADLPFDQVSSGKGNMLMVAGFYGLILTLFWILRRT